MSNLRRVAESIFEAASNPAAEYQNSALVVDRAGGVRVLDCAAWSLTAIISEFGASEVYLIARKSGQLKVEAWSTAEVCVVTKPAERARMRCGHP